MKTTIIGIFLILLPLLNRSKQTFNLVENNGIYYIQVEINNKPINLLVDTGASISMLNLNSKSKFNFTVRKTDQYFSGIGSRNFRYRVYGARLSNPNNKERIEFTFEAVDLEYITNVLKKRKINIDGIIGSDFFRKTNAIIDYSKKELIIYP